MRWLLGDNEQELNKWFAQLEIFGELRNVQQIIVEEEQTMAITYHLKNGIRYNQGLETGREEGAAESKTSFAHYLLSRTDHSDEEIARLVNVPLDFVKGLKNNMAK